MATANISGSVSPYGVSIAQSEGLKTIDEASVPRTVNDVTPALLSQIEHRLLKDDVAFKLPAARTLTPEDQLDALKHLESFSSGDALIDSMELMKVFQQCAMTMRKTGREQRAFELSAEISALTSAADEMKKAADWKLAAGIAQGVMSIAGGCLGIGFGREQLKTGNTAYGTMGQGVSQAVSGAGGIMGSALTYESELHNTQKTKLEAEAKVHEAGVEHSKEMMQQALEIIQDVKDKIAAIQQAQAETNRGIARNV